jgi:hypothetical protein
VGKEPLEYPPKQHAPLRVARELENLMELEASRDDQLQSLPRTLTHSFASSLSRRKSDLRKFITTCPPARSTGDTPHQIYSYPRSTLGMRRIDLLHKPGELN